MTIKMRPVRRTGRNRLRSILYMKDGDDSWSILWGETDLPQGKYKMGVEGPDNRFPDNSTVIRIHSFREGDGGIINDHRLKTMTEPFLYSPLGVEFEGT